MTVRQSTEVARTLDLRFHGSIPATLCAVFEDVAYRCRAPFNEAVTCLSAPHGCSLLWWVQGPPSRNTLASPFYHNFCSIHFVRRLVDEHRLEFHGILVDSPALKGILDSLLAAAGIRDCRVRVHRNLLTFAIGIKTRWFSIPLYSLRRALQYALARSTRRSPGLSRPIRPVVLIDTFVTAAYATTDRWYGGLWNLLDEDLRADTRYVPTIVETPLSRHRATCAALRNGARNVFIKDDFLEPSDLAGASLFRGQVRALAIPRVEACGFDLSELVREELETSRDIPTIMESILTYRFVGRLRQRGVKVRLAIDWFEGQAIDKAWNLGFRDHYPEAKRIGYRAFESFPFYLCSYPIPVERASGVLPDVMAVQGTGTIATVREFLPDLEVIVIPSFKAQYVWEYDLTHRKPAAVFTVLAALPISIDSGVRIVRKLLDIRDALPAGRLPVRYVIKPHPIVPAERIICRLGRGMPGDMTFTNEPSFGRLLADSNLLVTEASSTCLEALASGVPVVIIENETGLTYDPVPAAIPQAMFRRVRSSADLVDAIAHFATLPEGAVDEQRAHSKKIRADYFEPITPDGMSRFMDMETIRGEVARSTAAHAL